ncbi:hypothetical protein D049_3748B, partial [Vibrio parahaemolyticus VPTS-2010]
PVHHPMTAIAEACGNLDSSDFGKVSIRKASMAMSCVADAVAIHKASREAKMRFSAGLTPAMNNVATSTML